MVIHLVYNLDMSMVYYLDKMKVLQMATSSENKTEPHMVIYLVHNLDMSMVYYLDKMKVLQMATSSENKMEL